MSYIVPNIQRFTPTTGATIVVAANESQVIHVIIEPVGTIAVLTITPPVCTNGQKIIIMSTQIITAITITGSVFLLSTLGLNSNAGFIFNSSNSTWYKIQ